MRRTSPLQPASVALPESDAALRGFDAAAATFDAACAAHDYARDVLLDRLAWFAQTPQLIVDAGCGTGRGTAALQQRFAGAQVLGMDFSPAMLTVAAQRLTTASLARCDLHALPLAAHSVDLLVANLVLPWCDPLAVLQEFARVLAPDGLLLVSTTGPASLQEVRRAWRQTDQAVHVHASLDMQTLGDIAVRAGLREPVLDTDRIRLGYSSPARLHEELRALGAVNCAGGRRRSLTGTDSFRRYESALMTAAGARHGADDGIEVTLELIFLQAWGAPTNAAETAPEPQFAPQFRGIPLRRE